MIVVMVILLIVAAITIFLYQSFFSDTSKALRECSGYCAPSCDLRSGGAVAGSRQPLGDAWCQAGRYDISNREFTPEENTLFGRTLDGNAESIAGHEVPLRCCQPTGFSNTIPQSFLPASLRTGETDPDDPSTRIQTPTVRAYFGASNIALRNGESREIVSNKAYKYTLEVRGFDEEGLTIDGNTFECDSKFLNQRGKEIEGWEEFNTERTSSTGDICQSLRRNNQGITTTDVQINIPPGFEGQTIRLETAFIAEEGSAREIFTTSFRVINPIEFSSISNEWSREKTFAVRCRAETCNEFSYSIHTEPIVGVPEPQGDVCPEPFVQDNLDRPGENQARITINSHGINYLCVQATTSDGQEFVREVPIPIRIDRSPPIIQGTFDPLRLQTEITCSKNAGVHCSESVGYHYIDRAIDFLGALVHLSSNPEWCPQDPSQYRWVAGEREDDNSVSTTIPYQGNHQFMVLCIMGRDEVGNTNRDILVNWDIVQVANSQIAEGGPGSGFYGYDW